MQIPLALLALSAALTIASPAQAGEDDHDRARRAVESGEIKPLRSILENAEATYGGQLIEAELEREDGRLVYELKLLTVDGRLLKVYYDAWSGLPLNKAKHHHRK
ncbi:MAG TPA: PepSY domain-containing protein [Ferrovibrio sp.]|uniref:PepSY domain-containing protein n=1 Tax=Ferrovibrio sp. TaxID=1917215 RepID=UPI002ED06B5B